MQLEWLAGLLSDKYEVISGDGDKKKCINFYLANYVLTFLE